MTQETTFSPQQEKFVAAYMADREGEPLELDRVVGTPSGLAPEQMMTVLAHPGLKDRGLEVMADFMHPEKSMYFDAIFGANYGQQAIRSWLIPTMAEIAFIEFVPQQPSAVFETNTGAALIDEWKMVATLGDVQMPLADGISVRRFKDGWMTSVADVYDTMSSRTPPPADMVLPEGMPEPGPLPDYPEMNWPIVDRGASAPLTEAASAWVESRQRARAGNEEPATLEQASGLSNEELHAIHNHPTLGLDYNLVADLLHPTDSIYIDPIFGRFEGQQAIRSWMTDIMGKMGAIVFEPISEILWNGSTSVQMWKQVAELPAGDKVEMSWGVSVRRFENGWLVYCADYFDSFSLQKPEVQAAGQAAGSTITLEDILRYRS